MFVNTIEGIDGAGILVGNRPIKYFFSPTIGGSHHAVSKYDICHFLNLLPRLS